MSLRRRLFVPVLTALLPIIAIETYNQVQLRAAREQEIRTSAIDQARRVAAEQERIIDGVRNVLNTLAVLNSIRGEEATACNGLFKLIRPHFEGFQALVAARSDGTPFCATYDDVLPANIRMNSVADQHFFQQAMKNNRFVVGDLYFEPNGATYVFPLAMPILDNAGKPSGVVYVNYSLKWLAYHLKGAQWNEGQAFAVIDGSGKVLIRLPDWERYVGRPTPPDTWERIKSANIPFDFEARSSWDGVVRIIGVIPPSLGPGGQTIAVGLSRETAFSALNAATLRGVLVILLGALLALWLAWIIGMRLVRTPIEGLLETTRKWRQGDFKARAKLSGKTELGQLGEAFDAMATDLERALHYKDLLLRELSHRVMNSLQTISALFGLQARSMRDLEARQKFNEAVGRINSIALAYRRMQAADGVEAIDFADYLRELCADIEKSLMPERHGCRVDADSILLGPQQASSLSLIVNELVTNAIKHGDGDAPVDVKFGRSAEGCRLAVRNSGVLPADYDPAKGPGFGMQMVTMLTKQIGGRLDVSCMAGETEFSVTFTPTVPQPPQLTVVENPQNATGSSA